MPIKTNLLLPFFLKDPVYEKLKHRTAMVLDVIRSDQALSKCTILYSKARPGVKELVSRVCILSVVVLRGVGVFNLW